MEGFGEKGIPDGWDMALGTVRGFRTWTLRLTLLPAYEALKSITYRSNVRGWGYGGVTVNAPLLPDMEHACVEGMYSGQWRSRYQRDGWYDACCRHSHGVPASNCGCGFWAYWNPAADFELQKPWIRQMQGDANYELSIPLSGMIEGAGATIIGEKGFRTARARITDLSLPGFASRFVYEGVRRNPGILDSDMFFAPYLRIDKSLSDFLNEQLGVPKDLVSGTIYAAVEHSLGRSFKWHASTSELITACPPDENYGRLT